jgi:hypothetical protein
MPRFIVTPYEPDGIPHMVTVRPVLTAQELAGYNFDEELKLMIDLQLAITDAVVKRVQRYNRWSTARCLTRIRGILNATNAADNKTWDVFQNLIELTPETLWDITDRLAQSEVEVEIFNLDWTFTIDVNSLLEGAGGSFPIPTWAGKVRSRETWFEQVFNDQKINCAAFALNWAISKQPQRYKNVTLRNALILQNDLGWTETVAYDELGKFVEKYSEYKLNIITPPSQKPIYTFVGKDYIYNEKKNIIFLYYYQNPRLGVKHYALCESPLLKNDAHSMKWCYFCDFMFRRAAGHTCAHTCLEPSKPPAYKKCDHCGLFEYRNHLCFHKQCKTCQSFHKLDIVHRCPLLFKTKKDDGGEAFIVYDLESRFEVVESISQVVTSFSFTEDGYYEEGPTKPVHILGYEQNKHIANLVCAKDMFTNQSWLWFGEDCLEQFLGRIVFM